MKTTEQSKRIGQTLPQEHQWNGWNAHPDDCGNTAYDSITFDDFEHWGQDHDGKFDDVQATARAGFRLRH